MNDLVGAEPLSWLYVPGGGCVAPATGRVATAVFAIATVLAPARCVLPRRAGEGGFGFYGVRNGQYPTVDLNEVYVFRNKCSLTPNVTAYPPGVHRNTRSGYVTIPPYELGYVSDNWVDQNWTIVNC